MSWALLVGVLSGSISYGVPLLYATLGEVLVERGGIINLGLEGVLLIGASVGFGVTFETGSPALGILAAALAGALFNLVFGFLVVTRGANQPASGLIMMFLGMGLSTLIGNPYVGKQIAGLRKFQIPGAAGLPWASSTLFNYDILVYLAFLMAVLVWWLLFHTRWGLSLRAVGESPPAAFAAGRHPAVLKYQALFLGGLIAGIGGAHLSVGLTMTWNQGMTAGRGFIAIALVIFSKWHPLRAIVGAVLFGGAVTLQLQMQARGTMISPFLLDMIPYLLTLAVLLLWGGARRFAAPAGLGKPYRGAE